MASSYTIPSENWCRKTSLILIRCYKSHPCLYNTDHLDYHKKDKRAEAYEQITQTLQTIKPTITVIDVKKRIKTLLGQLNKAKKKHFKRGNNETKGNLKPKLWCYKELEFLLKLNKDKGKNTTEEVLTTPSISTFSEGIKRELSTDNARENLEARIKSTNVSEHISTKVNETKRQRRSSLEEAALAVLQVAESAVQDYKAYRQQNRPVEAFCQYLCTEMQQLRVETFNKLKIDMMELLNDALIKDKQHNAWHKVTNEVPSTSLNSSSIDPPVCHEMSGASEPFKKINLQKIKIFQPPSEEATYTQL